jgi:hypothetical protein
MAFCNINIDIEIANGKFSPQRSLLPEVKACFVPADDFHKQSSPPDSGAGALFFCRG